MKIGLLLDGGLERADGVQQYILMLGDWMMTQGHEVRYIIAGPNPLKIDHVISLAKNVPVRFNGNRLAIPLPASNRAVKQMLAAENFDVIHVQTPHSPLMGAKVVRLAPKQTAIVGTFHILPYGWINETGTKLLGMVLRRNLRRFDAFVGVSRPAVAFAKRAFNIEATIVPNMVDVTTFKRSSPNIATDTLNMLFLGRLVERKGCQQLLQALDILNRQNKLPTNTHLAICSDGPMRSELERFVSENNLSSLATFHGYISNEEKIRHMQEADISIFPSLSGESFGIVLIEAMAAGGGIVLGGDNPGYRSVLEDVPESIVDAHHPDRMAEQLYEFLHSPEKRSALFAKQQTHVEQFDVNRVAATVLSVYETCINEKINQ